MGRPAIQDRAARLFHPEASDCHKDMDAISKPLPAAEPTKRMEPQVHAITSASQQLKERAVEYLMEKSRPYFNTTALVLRRSNERKIQ